MCRIDCKKIQKHDQMEGAALCPTRGTFDASGVFFFCFCLSQDLSSPRDITQSLFLLACNLLSEFYMISTVSILNSLGVC